MPQPPILPIMSRGLTRSVPFLTMKTFIQNLAIGASLSVEFDTVKGEADPNQYNSAAAYPGVEASTINAVGPFLDALLFADGATLLRVEYAVDRGGTYRQPVPDTAIPASTAANISGLRMTGRFTRVTLVNDAGVQIAVEFGVYVRSA